MPVYNEADILDAVLAKLLDGGIEVVVLDNHSTDASAAIARARGATVVPFGRPDRFRETEALHEVLRIARETAARAEDHTGAAEDVWCIFHAADEIYASNREGETYKQAVERLAAGGANAIDHTSHEYYPTDDGFVIGDPEAYFTAYKVRDTHPQWRTWKVAPNVRLTDMGHCISYDASVTDAAAMANGTNRRGVVLAPERLIRKHYPIRSQAHGERKVLRERFQRGEDFTFSQYQRYKSAAPRFVNNPPPEKP